MEMSQESGETPKLTVLDFETDSRRIGLLAAPLESKVHQGQILTPREVKRWSRLWSRVFIYDDNTSDVDQQKLEDLRGRVAHVRTINDRLGNQDYLQELRTHAQQLRKTLETSELAGFERVKLEEELNGVAYKLRALEC